MNELRYEARRLSSSAIILRKSLRISLIVLVFLVAVYALRTAGHVIQNYAARRHQDSLFTACMNYSMPPGIVVLTNQPVTSPANAAHRSEYFSAYASPQNVAGPMVGFRPRLFDDWRALNVPRDPKLYYPGPAAVAFFHERKTPKGAALVTATVTLDRAVVNDLRIQVTCEHLLEKHFPEFRLGIVSNQSQDDYDTFEKNRRITVMAGQIDPSDASKFTIPILINNRPGTVIVDVGRSPISIQAFVDGQPLR